MQTTGKQYKGIQDLGLCGELGLENALRLTAVKTNKQCLERDFIDFTSKTKGMGGKRMKAPHESNSRKVQEWNNMMLPPQESMNNSQDLVDYNFYYDYNDRFYLYLKYDK